MHPLRTRRLFPGASLVGRAAILALCLLILPGCGPSWIVGIIFGINELTGSEDDATVPSIRIETVASGASRSVSGGVDLTITATDGDSDNVSLTATYAIAGGPDQPATLSPTSIEGSPSGLQHTVTWDAESDLGGTDYTDEITLTITPSDNDGSGQAITTNGFDYGGNGPVLAITGADDLGGDVFQVELAPGEVMTKVQMTGTDPNPDTLTLTCALNTALSTGRYENGVPPEITASTGFNNDVATNVGVEVAITLDPTGVDPLTTPGRIVFDIVLDDGSETDTATLLIRVNRPPTINVNGSDVTHLGGNDWIVYMQQDTALPGTVTVTGSDPDTNDPITLELELTSGGGGTIPANLLIAPDPAGGIISTATSTGPADAEITLDAPVPDPDPYPLSADELVFAIRVDDDASSDAGTLTIRVSQPPAVSDVTITPTSGGPYTTPVTQVLATNTDPDGLSDVTTVTVDLSEIGLGSAVTLLDDGANGDSAAGDGIFGLTNPGAVGNHVLGYGTRTITITATDNSLLTGDGATTFEITNDAPQISAPGVFYAWVGYARGFTVGGLDPGDLLTVTATGVPASSTWTDLTPGQESPVLPGFSMTPTPADLGDHLITFTTEDVGGLQDSTVVTIRVIPCPFPFDPTAHLDPSNGLRIEGAANGDSSGFSVSGAGDVNGDGYGDLLVGAHQADPNGDDRAGVVCILFGGPNGTGAADLGGVDDVFDLASELTVDTGLRIDGIDATDFTGRSVAGGGDFNRDGFDDIVIGADSRDPSGVAYVIFGAPSGTGATDLGGNDEVFDLESELTALTGLEIRGIGPVADQCGHSVSGAGDVNADGYADILVTAYAVDSFRGQTYLILGGLTGDQAAHVGGGDGILQLSTELDTDSGLLIEGIDQQDTAGGVASGAGDVNGDGYDDVIIGARNADPNGIQSAGETYLIFGGTNGTNPDDLGGVDHILDLATELNTDTGIRFDGQELNDQSGRSICGAGDINGDGYADLLIGAPNASVQGVGSDVGEVYLIFGATNGTSPGDLGGVDHVFDLATELTPSTGLRIDGPDPGDQAGFSVAGAGDVNGDGFADIILGAPWQPNSQYSNAAFIVFGGSTGASPNDLGGGDGVLELGTEFDGSVGLRILRVDADDRMGHSVSAAGDINRDGFADVLIGSPEADPSGRTGAGTTWLLLGSPYQVAPTATVTTVQPPNDAPRQTVGVTGDGSDASSPSTRCWIDWSNGNGPAGAGAPSQTTVTLRRSLDHFGTLPPAGTTLDVAWEISTERINADTVAILLQYTDGDLGALNEGTLSVWHTDDAANPNWQNLLGGGATIILTPERNRIYLELPAAAVWGQAEVPAELGHFVIVAP